MDVDIYEYLCMFVCVCVLSHVTCMSRDDRLFYGNTFNFSGGDLLVYCFSEGSRLCSELFPRTRLRSELFPRPGEPRRLGRGGIH